MNAEPYLMKYIRAGHSLGMTEPIMRANLQQAGWTIEQIEVAFQAHATKEVLTKIGVDIGLKSGLINLGIMVGALLIVGVGGMMLGAGGLIVVPLLYIAFPLLVIIPIVIPYRMLRREYIHKALLLSILSSVAGNFVFPVVGNMAVLVLLVPRMGRHDLPQKVVA